MVSDGDSTVAYRDGPVPEEPRRAIRNGRAQNVLHVEHMVRCLSGVNPNRNGCRAMRVTSIIPSVTPC